MSINRKIQIRSVGRRARLAVAVNFNRPHGEIIRITLRRRRTEHRDDSRYRKSGGGYSGSQLHGDFHLGHAPD
jgi:hypothetical protein